MYLGDPPPAGASLAGGDRRESRRNDRRPSKPAGRHWPDRTEIVAGLDVLAGGSWLGVNDWGVAAAVLNRHGSLGPAAGLRSRGELVLEALDHADAVAAAAALSDLDPEAYRSFNLIVADNREAFWLRRRGPGSRRIRCKEGLSIIAAGDLDELATRRLRLALPAFRAGPTPDPDNEDWAMASPSRQRPTPPNEPAMLRCGSVPMATARIERIDRLPARDGSDRRTVFRYAEWLPKPSPWTTSFRRRDDE